MISLFKIILAILLLGCLLDMPYGYFQLVRFVSMAGFAYFAFSSYEKGHQQQAIIYVLLTLLFQPFLKISLGRELWNVVDVIVAISLISTVFYNLRTEKNK
jgi:hypothetical protein